MRCSPIILHDKLGGAATYLLANGPIQDVELYENMPENVIETIGMAIQDHAYCFYM